jgi:hypothetical protein
MRDGRFNFPKKYGGLPTRRHDDLGFSEAPIHPTAQFAFPKGLCHSEQR